MRRAVPKAVLLLVALLIAGRLFPATGLLNAADETQPPGLYLEKSLGYTLLSPVCELLDNFSFLSKKQHLTMAVSVLLVTLAALVFRRRRQWLKILKGMCFFWAAYAWVFILCLFLPRPMAALRSTNPDDLVVDFHSHVDASRDGIPWFTLSASRAWHQGCGFHAAYITDHDIVNAAFQAQATNPRRAGDGLVFLPGEELSVFRQHLVILGNTEWIDPVPYQSNYSQVLGLIRELAARKNVLVIASLPEYNAYSWAMVPYFAAAGIHGFELATGAPQSLDFPVARRARVLEIVARRGLFCTAATDIHGYGYACLAWTVVRLPGWRNQSAAELDRAIRENLAAGKGRNVVPVVRSTAYPGDSWKTPLVLPAFVWGLARSLSWAETLVWLGVAGLWTLISQRRRS